MYSSILFYSIESKACLRSWLSEALKVCCDVREMIDDRHVKRLSTTKENSCRVCPLVLSKEELSRLRKFKALSTFCFWSSLRWSPIKMQLPKQMPARLRPMFSILANSCLQ